MAAGIPALKRCCLDDDDWLDQEPEEDDDDDVRRATGFTLIFQRQGDLFYGSRTYQ